MSIEQIKEKLNSQRGIKFRVRAKSLRILALNVGFNRFTSVNSARTPPGLFTLKHYLLFTLHFITLLHLWTRLGLPPRMISMICARLTEQIVNFQVRDLSRITPSGHSHSGVNFAIHKTVLKSNINGGVKQYFFANYFARWETWSQSSLSWPAESLFVKNASNLILSPAVPLRRLY